MHGGISFQNYKESFTKYTESKKINYLEIYNASEGFFGIQCDFAENDLYERMVEIANGREKYVYIRPESKEYLKEYIEDYAKGGMIDTHLKQFKKRYKKDGVDVSKTYD